jgi:hypothetical protein
MLAIRPPWSASIMPSFSAGRIVHQQPRQRRLGHGVQFDRQVARFSSRLSVAPLRCHLFQPPQPGFHLPPLAQGPRNLAPVAFNQLGFDFPQGCKGVGENRRLPVAGLE